MSSNSLNQNSVPIFEALQRHSKASIEPFHVPGHKHGRGLADLRSLVGDFGIEADLNAMKDIDDLANPISVIRDAQDLAAAAFGADKSHFLVNGTTGGIHAMFLAALSPGQKVILPRNAHKSAFSALILSGAQPVFLPVPIHKELGIPLSLSTESVEEAFQKHSDTRALFIVNPSYYGIAGNLMGLVATARKYDALCIVDEAHGCHFYFHPSFPETAMDAAADLCAVSLHKTGGSLTQSSLLLTRGGRLPPEHLHRSLQILQTTSASYLLMASIDLARRQLALRGSKLLGNCLELARSAAEKVNQIEGLHALTQADLAYPAFAFDPTKLVIFSQGLGLSGFQLEEILRKEHLVQIELADPNAIMAIITIADTEQSIDRLIDALKKIALKAPRNQTKKLVLIPPDSNELAFTPRQAFYAPKEFIPLSQASGRISGEMIMSYPPGIPVICPGEVLTPEILEYLEYLKRSGGNLQGNVDPYLNKIAVLT